MTMHNPRLPFSLDPLMAEAKRRARQRRLLLAALAAIAAGVAVGATLGTRTSDQARPAVGVASSSCRADQLHLTWQSAGAAAGTAYNAFTFRNSSASTCSLHGWPSFRFVMRDGRTIAPDPQDLIATAYRINHPPPVPRLVLRPGAAARLTVSEADGTGYNHACPQTRTVLVVPPGSATPLAVSAALFYCGPRTMSVLPIGRRQ